VTSYFNEVYLRDLNRYGSNIQERIVNKKEHDFNHFVQKSPNRVTVFIQDFRFEGVLQSKSYNEIETIDYFLTYKTIPIPTGTIIKVRSIQDINDYSYWIIVSKDNFVSAGYDRYTVVKLDREIRWITKDGLIYKALVHISGSGSGGSNKRLISAYKEVENSIVYLPNQILTLVMQDHEEIQRGIRINIKGQVWKISGYDNVTNDGVSYVTLEQDYFDKELDDTRHLDSEPEYQDGIADGEKIDEWTFNSNLREEIEDDKIVINLTKDEEVPVDFRAYYFNKPSAAALNIEVKDRRILSYKNRTFKGISKGETEVVVRLQDSPDIKGTFIVRVKDNGDATQFSVQAPARLKYGIPSLFYSTIPFSLESTEEYISVKEKGYFTKNDKQFYGLEITISQIIENLSLKFAAQDNQEFTKIVDVESPWIGG
jgi:hypothetical protein